MVQLLFKGGDIVGKIKNYPIVVDLEDSTFVVETSAGTRKLEFQQIKEHLQKIINEGGMDGIKSTADKAMQTASEASNAANNAVDLIKDVIQKNIANAYIKDRHLYIVLTDETTIDAGVVEPQAEYGICYDTNTKNPKLTRVGAAVGLVAGIGSDTDGNVVNDFDSIYPWCDIKRCTLAANGTVTSYKGDANYIEDGSIGDVMVEIPKFYIKRVVEKSTGFVYRYICKEKLNGYHTPQAFLDANGNEIDKIYIAAYSVIDEQDEKLCSCAGALYDYIRYMKFSELLEELNTKGSNWFSLDVAAMEVLQTLFMVEFATLNSRSVFDMSNYAVTDYKVDSSCVGNTTNTITVTGNFENRFVVGRSMVLVYIGANGSQTRVITNVEQGDNVTHVTFNGDPFLITEKTTFYEESPASGCCNEVITSSGYLSGYPKGGRPWGWRGIEMLWGLDTVHIGGVVSKGKALYVTTDANADLSSIKSQDDLDADERLHKLSYSLPDNGYISELGFDQNYPWAAFPISTAATSQDGFCDELTSTGLITAVKEYSIATGLFEYNMHNRTNQCSCRFAYRKYS